MNDESDSRMVRLPVRDMRDEPAPQRAAQEGDLPPLPKPRTLSRGDEDGAIQLGYTADQMREYARLALAAAGGGVPQGMDIGDLCDRLAAVSHAIANSDDREAQAVLGETLRVLASSTQPEAAPAVAQVPQGCGKLCQRYEDGDGQLCGSKCAAAPEAPAQRCPYCDDTGDVHTPTGEWRGRCTCPAGTEAPAHVAPSAGEVERGDVVAFEFYNRATGHAIVDYSVNTHVGNLSAAKGYEARPLVYAAPRQNVPDGAKPIPAWQAREALDELEAAARGDAPFNHQAAAVVRAALSHKEPKP